MPFPHWSRPVTQCTLTSKVFDGSNSGALQLIEVPIAVDIPQFGRRAVMAVAGGVDYRGDVYWAYRWQRE